MHARLNPSITSRRFDFVLLPDFSMLSLISAIETLQNANLCLQRDFYCWQLCSQDGASVRSSLGMNTDVGKRMSDIGPTGDIVVVGGVNIHRHDTEPLKIWLRRHARGDVRVTGLCTGAYALARAGMLETAPATLHWQYRDSFSEAFPDIALSSENYVCTDARCMTSGGVSAIDLFLDFIGQDFGETLASQVAESMSYTAIREVQKGLRVDVPSPSRARNPRLARTLMEMEQNLEAPLTPQDLAERAGISVRQLERLFRSQLGTSPKKFYMRLRLRRAWLLLVQTQLDVIDVALACGFHSPSHFSKCFRAEFGISPRQLQRGQPLSAG